MKGEVSRGGKVGLRRGNSMVRNGMGGGKWIKKTGESDGYGET